MYDPSIDVEESAERMLGRYRLHQELASGGMARVYLASVDTLDGFYKLVALKRIHEHLARDPAFVDMFLDEARLAARIEHPNVCTVFDYGRAEGESYIAMEYLVGETLRDVLMKVIERPWAPEWPYRAAHLIAQAAEGLHAAHELLGDDGAPAGVVHRDISPHNLFVTYAGVVKVVDFGIARAEGKSHHTAPGTIKGKFAYVAPEQIAARDTDRRTDVWSLGVTLWEMLTLRPLFRRKGTVETLGAVATYVIPPPSTLCPRIPAALDDIVLRALRRDPAERYASARELNRALVTFCREQVEIFDCVDVENWMADLFPHERVRKLSLPQVLRDTSAVRRISAVPSMRDAQNAAHRVPIVGLPPGALVHPPKAAAEPPRAAEPSIEISVDAPLPPPMTREAQTPPAPPAGPATDTTSAASEASYATLLPMPSHGALAGPLPPPGPPTGLRRDLLRGALSAGALLLASVVGAATVALLDRDRGVEHREARGPMAEGAEPAKASPEADPRLGAEAAARVNLHVSPWAEVQIDGQAVGRTPLSGLTLAAGRHTVDLHNPELERRHRIELSLAPGETREVVARLDDF